MQKAIRKNNIILVTMVTILALILPFMVITQNAGAVDNRPGSREVLNGSSNSNAGSDTAAQKKLQGESLKSCQSREAVMNNVMSRISDRGQKQIAVIESIRQKVQTFYTEKNVTVGNYESLNANIEAKKQVATAAMNSVRAMNGSFGCGKDDPKGIATQFKSTAVAQSDAVTDYKNAVHDLVVSVKTAVTDSTTTEEN